MSSTSIPQYKVLQAVRDAAACSTRQYSSAKTREDLVTSFKEAFNGLEPYTWQLDISEALLLGLDCVAIAGSQGLAPEKQCHSQCHYSMPQPTPFDSMAEARIDDKPTMYNSRTSDSEALQCQAQNLLQNTSFAAF
jgi:hypothetical protein